jgi:hypothetical protein
VLSLLADLAAALTVMTSKINTGPGGLGAHTSFVVSLPAFFPIAAIVGFAAGFSWQFRRSGTRSHPAV